MNSAGTSKNKDLKSPRIEAGGKVQCRAWQACNSQDHQSQNKTKQNNEGPRL